MFPVLGPQPLKSILYISYVMTFQRVCNHLTPYIRDIISCIRDWEPKEKFQNCSTCIIEMGFDMELRFAIMRSHLESKTDPVRSLIHSFIHIEIATQIELSKGQTDEQSI